MGYVHYIWHPRGPLYPICSEKFDIAFCLNIDLPTSSWIKAEWLAEYWSLVDQCWLKGRVLSDSNLYLHEPKNSEISHNTMQRFHRNTYYTTLLKTRRQLKVLHQDPPVVWRLLTTAGWNAWHSSCFFWPSRSVSAVPVTPALHVHRASRKNLI